LSIWTAHHDWAVQDGMSSEEYFDYHRERGLSIPAAEVILDWATTDRRAVAEANAHILEVAAGAGASSVITVTLEPEMPPLAEAAVGLAELCDLAADRGLAISYEFLPWTAVPDLGTALRLLEVADRDNLGLVIDAWHWFHQAGERDYSLLRAVPAERIHILHLDDAPADHAGDRARGTGPVRLLPGEGAIDIFGLLDVLDEMGASPVIASEVQSAALGSLGPAENARRQHAAVSAVLAQHRARKGESSGSGSSSVQP
jgi:sugar phosphate isomerase/epimerase